MSQTNRHHRLHVLASLCAVALLGGCNVQDRLSNVGKVPELAPISNPTTGPGYQPVSLPMPAPDPTITMAPNSLWRSGARGFFKDQRAHTIGDILTVQVVIDDEASLKNETDRTRNNSEGVEIGGFWGVDGILTGALNDVFDPTAAVDLGSDSRNKGQGSVNRNESIELEVAALITQVLPNGNFVIQGRQEVRVNFEVRELIIAGVVRPEDIDPLNTISHEKIAELRVAYGGRGQISDVQQPRYGTQVFDILMPF